MLKNEPNLRAPIPGMSLTAELGSRPWQQPPQYATVEEAIDFYVNAMSTEDFYEKLPEVLQLDVPVTELSNAIMVSSVMDGRHTIDVGVIVMPIIMEMIMYIADKEGIEYVSGLEEAERDYKADPAVVGQVVKKLKVKSPDETGNAEMPAEEPEVEMAEEEVDVMPKGLMARR